MPKNHIGLFILFAATLYTGPIPGNVNSPPKFLFSHTSDWQSRQIVNTIRNDHRSESLIVFWPEAGITRPEQNPLPPNSPEIRKIGCTEDSLAKNISAQLFYGLSYTPKTAGVYKVKQEGEKRRRELMSEIISTIKGRPYHLVVTSSAVPGEYIEYVFDQNMLLEISLPLSPDSVSHFERAKWSVKPGALSNLKFGKLPLKEYLPNFGAYNLLKPPSGKSVIKMPVGSSELRSLLIFISDPDMNLMTSGVISLHIPR